jgi:hypothetical protein
MDKFDKLFETIDKNPFRETCVPHFTKEKEELRRLVPKESLWGGGVRGLNPPRLTTAWLCMEDPLMILAGSGYRQTEVRDKTFELQQEAAMNLKGNRKLPKTKVAEALSSLRPTEEQTKTVAAVLLALKQIQTVCFDEQGKKVWTMPEDLCLWSKEKKTLWVNSTCEQLLEFEESPNLGHWLDNREREGWTIPWPEADCSFEEMKARMATDHPEIIVKGTDGKKPKKDDYAKALGRCDAIVALR